MEKDLLFLSNSKQSSQQLFDLITKYHLFNKIKIIIIEQYDGQLPNIIKCIPCILTTTSKVFINNNIINYINYIHNSNNNNQIADNDTNNSCISIENGNFTSKNTSSMDDMFKTLDIPILENKKNTSEKKSLGINLDDYVSSRDNDIANLFPQKKQQQILR